MISPKDPWRDCLGICVLYRVLNKYARCYKLFFKAIKPLVASSLTVDVKAVLSKFSHNTVYGTDVGLFYDVQGGEVPTLRQQIKNTPKAFALFNAGGVHGQNGMSLSSNAAGRRSWRSS